MSSSRRDIEVSEAAPALDAQLLGAFIQGRDESAFAELVRRHGPLVFGVCRRMLGNEHDAADAFQAVFMVLARKAASIRAQAAVGAWLYHVAYRTSMKARTALFRRRAREGQVGVMPEPAVEAEQRDDVMEVLDAELRALPRKYQEPIILCDLQGQSRKDVAALLRVPEGTVSSRLATGRKQLAQRLRRRGVTISAAMLATLLGATAASASVPAPLSAATVQAAVHPAAAAASTQALALCDGVMHALALGTLQMILLAIVAPCLLCGALRWSLDQQPAEPDEHTRALARLQRLGARIHWEVKGVRNQVVSVNLKRTRVQDGDLSILRVFQELRELNLRETAIGDAGCRTLAELPKLEKLRLHGTAVSDVGLKALARLQQLRVLDLEGTRVGDDGLGELAALRELRELDLRRTVVSDAGLKTLAPLTAIESLWLNQTKVSDAGLRHLASLPRLRLLYVGETAVSDAGLPTIASMRDLEAVSLEGDAVTNAGLPVLGALPKLATLKLGGTGVDDRGIATLASFKNLRWLSLDRCAVTGAGLAALPPLTTLWLNGTRLSDETLPNVAGLVSLETLQLGGTAITDAGIPMLASLDQLGSLALDRTAVTDGCLLHLRKFSRLWQLNVSETQVTDSGLDQLADFPRLRWLGLHRTRITDAGLQHLIRLPGLEGLLVSWTKVDDSGLRTIGRLKNLRSLWLGGCPITDAGLAELAPLEQLRLLWLDWTKVTDRGLHHLAALKQLEELRLEGTGVSDIGGGELGPARRLTGLELQRMNIKVETAPAADVPNSTGAGASTPRAGATPQVSATAWSWPAALAVLIGLSGAAWLVGQRTSPPRSSLWTIGPSLSFVGCWLVLALVGASSSAQTPSGAMRLLRGHTGPVHALRFTPDGRRLVSASGWPGRDNSVRIWDVATGQELHKIRAPGQVGCVELSPDGRCALAGAQGGLLYIDVTTGELLRTFKSGNPAILSVAFAADGKHLYTGAQDGFARRWRFDDGTEVNRYRVKGKWARLVAELADGRLLTADSGRRIQIWDVATGSELDKIEPDDGWLASARLAPGGGQVVLGGWHMKVWDLASRQQVRSFEGHKSDVTDISFSPDGKRLLSACLDGTARLWDYEQGTLLQVLGHGEFVFAATYSADGTMIASGGGGRKEGKDFLAGSDHDIRLWDLGLVTATPAAPVSQGRAWKWLVLAAILMAGSFVALVFVRRRPPAIGTGPTLP